MNGLSQAACLATWIWHVQRLHKSFLFMTMHAAFTSCPLEKHWGQCTSFQSLNMAWPWWLSGPEHDMHAHEPWVHEPWLVQVVAFINTRLGLSPCSSLQVFFPLLTHHPFRFPHPQISGYWIASFSLDSIQMLYPIVSSHPHPFIWLLFWCLPGNDSRLGSKHTLWWQNRKHLGVPKQYTNHVTCTTKEPFWPTTGEIVHSPQLHIAIRAHIVYPCRTIKVQLPPWVWGGYFCQDQRHGSMKPAIYLYSCSWAQYAPWMHTFCSHKSMHTCSWMAWPCMRKQLTAWRLATSYPCMMHELKILRNSMNMDGKHKWLEYGLNNA